MEKKESPGEQPDGAMRKSEWDAISARSKVNILYDRIVANAEYLDPTAAALQELMEHASPLSAQDWKDEEGAYLQCVSEAVALRVFKRIIDDRLNDGEDFRGRPRLSGCGARCCKVE